MSDDGSSNAEKKLYLKSGVSLRSLYVMYVTDIQDTVEYRKKMRLLKVRTFDNTMRTLMVEEAKTVDELMDVICKRIGIPNNHEYSLASTKDAVHEAQINKKMDEQKRFFIDKIKSNQRFNFSTN